jgi:hypothetical protein
MTLLLETLKVGESKKKEKVAYQNQLPMLSGSA